MDYHADDTMIWRFEKVACGFCETTNTVSVEQMLISSKTQHLFNQVGRCCEMPRRFFSPDAPHRLESISEVRISKKKTFVIQTQHPRKFV